MKEYWEDEVREEEIELEEIDNEEEMVATLMDAVQFGGDVMETLCEATTQTYEDAGIMTYNKGFVIRLANGHEFQVTVVQSA